MLKNGLHDVVNNLSVLIHDPMDNSPLQTPQTNFDGIPRANISKTQEIARILRWFLVLPFDRQHVKSPQYVRGKLTKEEEKNKAVVIEGQRRTTGQAELRGCELPQAKMT